MSGRTAPMLALYVAQTAMLQRDLDSVARMIDQLPPEFADHPDVRAMNVSLERTVHSGRTAKCPPMLAASYFEALLPGDAEQPRTIPVGSLAEHVSATALQGGPWLQWLPTERRAPNAAAVVPSAHRPARPARRAGGAGLRGVLGRPDGIQVTVFGGGVGGVSGHHRGRSGLSSPINLRDLGLAVVRRKPMSNSQLSPAAQRVAPYVSALAQRRGASDEQAIADLGVAELARRLAMPRSLTESAVRELSLMPSTTRP